MIIEIIPGLWLGDKKKSENGAFLQDKKIKCLVNTIKDLEFLNKFDEYNDSIRHNIERYKIIKLSNYLKDITTFIHNKLLDNNNILVYCEDGNHKSALVILSYIVRYGNINRNIGIKMIQTKNPDAFLPLFLYEGAFNHFIKNK